MNSNSDDMNDVVFAFVNTTKHTLIQNLNQEIVLLDSDKKSDGSFPKLPINKILKEAIE